MNRYSACVSTYALIDFTPCIQTIPQFLQYISRCFSIVKPVFVDRLVLIVMGSLLRHVRSVDSVVLATVKIIN